MLNSNYKDIVVIITFAVLDRESRALYKLIKQALYHWATVST